ncbi:MAG: OmpA family protein [Phreatobacter sp.]|nr:OmpA family protein [Phreatobacter sp.]
MAQPPGTPPPAIGQRGPGTPGAPGVAQPPGTPPPAIGQRGPGTPGTPGVAQPPGTLPPAIGQRGPGAPGTPPGVAQPPGTVPGAVQPPAVGQRGPGMPGTVPPGAAPGGVAGGQPPSGPPERRRGSRIGPAGAAAIGVGAGLVGGFMLSQGARAERVDQVRERRREFTQDGVTVIHEPGRTIVRDGEGVFIRHDETARFRDLGGDFRTERRGNEMVSFYDRPGGVRVITVTDDNGQLVRRVRRYPDGREVILIDNSFRPRARTFEDQIIVLPPPQYSMARERYIVDAGVADEDLIYETLTAPPVQRPPRRYTLDEVRHSPTVRAYTRSVDVDTINFDLGSWEVKPDQVSRLDKIAAALGRAITANPNEVFLIEGHTDLVGNDMDNLSLSDRRAQAVAAVLTQSYNIPPENLTTQGYGEQYPKVQTEAASRENRRVTLRRVTELLNQQNTQAPQQ